MDVDWCKTASGMAAYSERSPKDFKAAGISHVRLRVKEDADEALLKQLDQQIDDCLANGLIPIIAYQADALKNDPSSKNLDRVTAWWKTVAQRYADRSYLLSFDLIIEVTDALNDQPDRLNELYEQLVSAVRESNPRRIVMISPRLRSDAACLKDLTIPSAANGYLMAEWHFYAAGPSKENPRKLWTTGTMQEQQLILDKINAALQWQKDTGIPTWVGAWMPGNYNDGNTYTISEQTVFASYMTKALTDAGIPFAVNADTHFYDRENALWIPSMEPVLQAIYAQGTLPFTDLSETAWYYPSVAYVYRNGLFSGTSDKTFSPSAAMTREQLWMVLSRMAGQQPPSMADARVWAVESGMSDGRNPTHAVTREQFVTFLWRFAGSPAAKLDLSGYTDFETVSSYAVPAMQWAVGQGIVSGTSASALTPQAQASRAQIAVILTRYLQNSEA